MKRKNTFFLIMIILGFAISFIIGLIVGKSKDQFAIRVEEQPAVDDFQINFGSDPFASSSSEMIVRVGENVILPDEEGRYSLSELSGDISIYNSRCEIQIADIPPANPIKCEEVQASPTANSAESSETNGQTQGRYVGSKNSDKFHDPDCSFAIKIKDENKVWFQTYEEAISAGYKPSSCATID